VCLPGVIAGGDGKVGYILSIQNELSTGVYHILCRNQLHGGYLYHTLSEPDDSVATFSFSHNDRVRQLRVLGLHLQGSLGSEVSFGWDSIAHSFSVSLGLCELYWNVANHV